MVITNYDLFLNESKKQKKSHDYGCIMMMFDIPNWDEYLNKIDKDDIFTENGGYGLEKDPHVTILYGIYDSVDVNDIKPIVSGVDLSKYVTFNNISIFSNPLAKCDVVKFETDSELLHNLNADCRYHLPYMETHPVYNPHMTIAYVKYGRGVKYMEMLKDPLVLKPSKIVYSVPNLSKEKHVDLIKW